MKFSDFEIKDQSPGKSLANINLNFAALTFEGTSRSNDKMQIAKHKNTITGKAPKCLSTLQLLTTIKFGISSHDTFDDTTRD